MLKVFIEIFLTELFIGRTELFLLTKFIFREVGLLLIKNFIQLFQGFRQFFVPGLGLILLCHLLHGLAFILFIREMGEMGREEEKRVGGTDKSTFE